MSYLKKVYQSYPEMFGMSCPKCKKDDVREMPSEYRGKQATWLVCINCTHIFKKD